MTDTTKSGDSQGALVGDDLERLSEEECWSLLASLQLGRLAIVHDGFPEIYPLGYQVTERDGLRAITFRTRAENTIERHGAAVCFQSDGPDAAGSGHWTVLAKGYLRPGGGGPDPHATPIGHEAWKTIVVSSVTGRRFRAAPIGWAFNPQAYL